MLRISTIVPAYNCAAYLERAVDSLRATGYPDLEIVIVDDGSTDGTWDVARRLAATHAGRVLACCHPSRANRGVSATRNLGIAQSRGELIALLDADDYVYPNRFESAVRILSEHSDVDGVYQTCEVAFADETAEQRWFKDAPLFGFTEAIAPAQLLPRLLTGMCWATSAILFRRSILERTGLFHPRLSIAEDCHLWMRMACAGTLVAGDLSRPVSVYWRRNDSAYQPSPCRRLQMIRAMASFLRWLRRRDPNDDRLAAATRCVEDYILGAIIAARSHGECRVAWSVALTAFLCFPRVALRRQFAGNLARMVALRGTSQSLSPICGRGDTCRGAGGEGG